MKKGDKICELRLCEYLHTYLKPNVIYRFTVDPKCPRCVELAKEAAVDEEKMYTVKNDW